MKLSRTTHDTKRFDTAHAIGLIAENAFKDLLVRRFKHEIIFTAPSDKPFKDWDIISKGINFMTFIHTSKEISWEIKHSTKESPNVAVQFWHSTKSDTDIYLPDFQHVSCNSGIFRTEADYYVIYDSPDSTFYIAPTDKLREIIKFPHYKKLIANKSQTEQTAIALIPKKDWMFKKERYVAIDWDEEPLPF